MRNVTRPPIPPSLHKNAAKWRRELLAALGARNPDRRAVDRLSKRYNRADVRDSLDQMYGDLCCYCEAPVGAVAFQRIEHRRPKARFPKQTFAWENLHLGCPKCNQAKGDKWDNRDQILDSVTDNPIDDHMTYRFRPPRGCVRWPITQRGRTTIAHADLNRRKLCDARTLIAHSVLDTIIDIKNAPRSPSVDELRHELVEKMNGPFGSVIRWLLKSF